MSRPCFRIDAPDTPWHGLPADGLILRSAEAIHDPVLANAIEESVSETRSRRAQLLLRTVIGWQRRGQGVDLRSFPLHYQDFIDTVTGVSNLSEAAIRAALDRCPPYPVGLVRLWEALRVGAEVDKPVHDYVRAATHTPAGELAPADAVRDFFRSGRRTALNHLSKPGAPVRYVKVVLHEDWAGPDVAPRPPRSANRFLILVPTAVLEGLSEDAPQGSQRPADGSLPPDDVDPVLDELLDTPTPPPSPVRPPSDGAPTPPERRPVPSPVVPVPVPVPEPDALPEPGVDPGPDGSQLTPAVRLLPAIALSAVVVLAGVGFAWPWLVAEAPECPAFDALADLDGLDVDVAHEQLEHVLSRCPPDQAAPVWASWARRLREHAAERGSPLATISHELDAWQAAYSAAPSAAYASAWLTRAREVDQDLDAIVKAVAAHRDTPGVARVRLELALERFDLEEARRIVEAHADEPSIAQWEGLVRAWTHRGHVPNDRRPAFALDLDGTGEQWFAVASDGRAAAPGARHLRALRDPLSRSGVDRFPLDVDLLNAHAAQVDGRRVLVGVGTDRQIRVVDAASGASVVRPGHVGHGEVHGVEVADLDRDGREELYLAVAVDEPGIVALAWRDGQLAPTPMPGLDLVNGLGAHFTGVHALGPGPEGAPRLLVAAESWTGLGLYVVDHDGLVERRLVGNTRELGVADDGSLYLAMHDLTLGASRWPDAAGVAPLSAGVAHFDTTQAALPLVAYHAFPVPGGRTYLRQPRELFVADLDGDGTDDVLTHVQGVRSMHDRVLVYRGGADGLSDPLELRGGYPLAVRRRTDAPAEVLLVHAPGEQVLLGATSPAASSAPLPSLAVLSLDRSDVEVPVPGGISGANLHALPLVGLDPLAVRFVDEGIRFRVEGPGHHAAEVPLTPMEGTRLVLDLDLRTDRLTFGSPLEVGLVPRGERGRNEIGLNRRAGGGAGMLGRRDACYFDTVGSGVQVGGEPPPSEPMAPDRVRVRVVVDLTPGQEQLACGLWRGGSETVTDWWATAPQDPEDLTEGPLSLVLRNAADGRGWGSISGEATLTRLHLEGVAPDGDAADAGERMVVARRWASLADDPLVAPGFEAEVSARVSGRTDLARRFRRVAAASEDPLEVLRAMVMAEQAGLPDVANELLNVWLDTYGRRVPTTWIVGHRDGVWSEDHELWRVGRLAPNAVGNVLARSDQPDAAARFWAALVRLEAMHQHPDALSYRAIEQGLLLSPDADPPELYRALRDRDPERDLLRVATEGLYRRIGAKEPGQMTPAERYLWDHRHVLDALNAARANQVGEAAAAAEQIVSSGALHPIVTVDRLLGDPDFYRIVEEHPGPFGDLLGWGCWRLPLGDAPATPAFGDLWGLPGTDQRSRSPTCAGL